MNSLNEFEIIRRFFTRPVKNVSRFPLGIGDDAALISPPQGQELVTSIDTLVAGTHFLPHSDPNDLGYKSLAVSLSDLAAMGAEPSAVLLALTLPDIDEPWLTNFTNGFFGLAEQYQVELLGGNLTRGPLSISTVIFGWTPAGKALRRSGAKPGDDIYITGSLGEAGLALQRILSGHALTPELHQRFFRPQPRVQAGLALREIATAAIDISDGLAADLDKLLAASGVGGNIQIQRLPISPILRQQCTNEQAQQWALTAGEDYELCFTASPSARPLIDSILISICRVQRLGTVTQESGLKIWGADGKLVSTPTTGFQHF
jgi:thiamine-monophosphate kinase